MCCWAMQIAAEVHRECKTEVVVSVQGEGNRALADLISY